MIDDRQAQLEARQKSLGSLSDLMDEGNAQRINISIPKDMAEELMTGIQSSMGEEMSESPEEMKSELTMGEEPIDDGMGGSCPECGGSCPEGQCHGEPIDKIIFKKKGSMNA